ARQAGWARDRSTAAALAVSQAAGRRRLRAWLQRRRRRADATRVAEDHRARAAVNPGAPRWRRQRRRDERLRMHAAWSSWRRAARGGRALRSERQAAVTAARSRLRRRAMQAWRDVAQDKRRWRCLLADVVRSRARSLGREGLRGLQYGALKARARRDAFGVGEEHWRRRGVVVLTSQIR
ncbi:unnamed protein product, partial [Hapterophycus canaliculatus]